MKRVLAAGLATALTEVGPVACAASSVGALAAGMSTGSELEAGRTLPSCIVAEAVTVYDWPACSEPSGKLQMMVLQLAVRHRAFGGAIPLGQAVTVNCATVLPSGAFSTTVMLLDDVGLASVMLVELRTAQGQGGPAGSLQST